MTLTAASPSREPLIAKSAPSRRKNTDSSLLIEVTESISVKPASSNFFAAVFTA